MGEFFQPQTNELPGTKPSPWSSSSYFTNLMNQNNTPQVTFPGAPATQGAMQDMQTNISQYGPALGEFYSGLMRTGNMPKTNQIMDAQAKAYQNTIDQIKAQSGLLPRGSAQSRYLGGALGEATNQYNLANQQMLLNAEQQGLQNQLAGAQGLTGLPGYYAQPSSLELSLLGLQTPYDLANQQAFHNQQSLQAGILSQLLAPTPLDYQVTPSQAQQLFGLLGPLLAGLGKGFASGYPTAIGGGEG